jgi:putative Holliday junction resolvase
MAGLRLLLGFDYGTKQIGVAVGQVITGQARELCTLKAQNGVPDWDKVQALITEWKPDAIVVGLPLNMDGTPSEMSARAEKFSRKLNGRFNLPVYTHDERLTTFRSQGRARLSWRPARQLPRQPGGCHCRSASAAKLAGSQYRAV